MLKLIVYTYHGEAPIPNRFLQYRIIFLSTEHWKKKESSENATTKYSTNLFTNPNSIQVYSQVTIKLGPLAVFRLLLLLLCMRRKFTFFMRTIHSVLLDFLGACFAVYIEVECPPFIHTIAEMRLHRDSILLLLLENIVHITETSFTWIMCLYLVYYTRIFWKISSIGRPCKKALLVELIWEDSLSLERQYLWSV